MARYEELTTTEAVLAASEAGRRVEYTEFKRDSIDMPPSNKAGSGGWVIANLWCDIKENLRSGRYRAPIEEAEIVPEVMSPGGTVAPDAQPAERQLIADTSLHERALAWDAVAAVLDELSPKWTHRDGTGIECAVAAIRGLVRPSQKVCSACGGEGEIEVTTAEGHEWREVCEDCSRRAAWDAVAAQLDCVRPGWKGAHWRLADSAVSAIRSLAQPIPVENLGRADDGVDDLAKRIGGWVCEARNEWTQTHEDAWLEDDSGTHPDTYIGEYVARRLQQPERVEGVEGLLASENPNRKDFTVDEALAIADRHDSAHKHVPSVSRTLAAEVRRLRPQVDEAETDRRARELLAAEFDRDGIPYVANFIRSDAMLTRLESRAIRAIRAALNPEAEYPECSGDPASCPENEGYGCCKPNASAIPAGFTPGSLPKDAAGEKVSVIFRNGQCYSGRADELTWLQNWLHFCEKPDIIAYRVEPSQQGEAVDDALEEAFRRYPHAHDALTFLACAIRGPVKPSKADLEWAVSQAFPDGNATIPVESLGRDADGVEGLAESIEQILEAKFTLSDEPLPDDCCDVLREAARRLRPQVSDAMVERAAYALMHADSNAYAYEHYETLARAALTAALQTRKDGAIQCHDCGGWNKPGCLPCCPAYAAITAAQPATIKQDLTVAPQVEAKPLPQCARQPDNCDYPRCGCPGVVEAKAGADEPHCQDYPNCPNLSCSACEKAQARAAQRGSAFLLWADANSMNTATAPDGRFFDPMTAVAEKAYRAAEFGAALVQPEANSSEPPKGSFSKVGADEGRQWADDDFYAGHPPPVLHDDPMTNAEILIQALSDRLDTARRALADAAAMQVVQPTLSQIKANAAWAMTETDPRRLLPRSATYGAQPKPTEGGAVASEQLARDILASVAFPSGGHGADIMRDVSIPMRGVVNTTEALAAIKLAMTAGSGEADYECRAHACRRVRVEMQAEISRLRAGSGEAVAVVTVAGYPQWLVEWLESPAYRYLPEGTKLYAGAPPADAEALKARPRVFIDMDGVIVDFDAYKTAQGLTGDEVKRKVGAYLDMPAIPGAIEAVRSVIGMGYEVWIATKPPTGVAHAYSDKAAWVLKHLPELKRRIVVTHDKGLLGDSGDFLCDDRPHKANCEQFAGTLLRFVDGYHWPQALDALRAARRLTGKGE